MGRVNEFSLFSLRFQVSLLPPVEIKMGLVFCVGSFVFNAVFLQARHSFGRLVTASPKTPARPSRFPPRIPPTGEGWRLGFFANKATDG